MPACRRVPPKPWHRHDVWHRHGVGHRPGHNATGEECCSAANWGRKIDRLGARVPRRSIPSAVAIHRPAVPPVRSVGLVVSRTISRRPAMMMMATSMMMMMATLPGRIRGVWPSMRPAVTGSKPGIAVGKVAMWSARYGRDRPGGSEKNDDAAHKESRHGAPHPWDFPSGVLHRSTNTMILRMVCFEGHVSARDHTEKTTIPHEDRCLRYP